jgi:hypothetical protein
LKSINFNAKTKSRNGLINNHGLINGNGLTDGNGLTINLFTKSQEGFSNISQASRITNITIKKRKIRFFQAIISIILIIVPLSLYLIEFESEQPRIEIDGNFDDWSGNDIISCSDFENTAIKNPSVDMVDCRVYHNENSFDFFVQTQYYIFGREYHNRNSGGERYCLNVFIDHDLKTATGYQIDCLGADERLEVSGQNGVITKAQSFYFESKTDANDWSGWVQDSNINIEKEGFRLEGHHTLSYRRPFTTQRSESYTDFNSKDHNVWEPLDKENGIGVIFHLSDSKGNLDKSEPMLTTESNWLKMKLKDISPSNIQTPNMHNPITEIQITTNSPSIESDGMEPFQIERIGFQYQLYNLDYNGDILNNHFHFNL